MACYLDLPLELQEMILILIYALSRVLEVALLRNRWSDNADHSTLNTEDAWDAFNLSRAHLMLRELVPKVLGRTGSLFLTIVQEYSMPPCREQQSQFMHLWRQARQLCIALPYGFTKRRSKRFSRHTGGYLQWILKQNSSTSGWSISTACWQECNRVLGFFETPEEIIRLRTSTSQLFVEKLHDGLVKTMLPRIPTPVLDVRLQLYGLFRSSRTVTNTIVAFGWACSCPRRQLFGNYTLANRLPGCMFFEIFMTGWDVQERILI